jgi:NO-binding membrane sensor protein with MHYT domain
MPVMTVHNFSYGPLNPALGYAVSCVGSFLGLRCVILARAYRGLARALWLGMAAVSIGATGIWAMHFVAMLGFTIPGQQIRYNVPMTIASMLVTVAVVGIGLFIVGFGDGGRVLLLVGGVIVGVGVAAMHSLGMAAMSMQGSMTYDRPLLALSTLIAIAAGTAVLWAGTRIRGVAATIGASLIMGVAIGGMHYTAMAALRVYAGSMPSMAVPSGAVTSGSGMTAVSGATGASFLIPVLLIIGIATFLTTLTISMSPTEDEIRANAEMEHRMEYLQQRRDFREAERQGPAVACRYDGYADDGYADDGYTMGTAARR